MPKKEPQNRASTLQKVKSVILSSHAEKSILTQYADLHEFCQSALKSIDLCRASISISNI